MRDTTSGDFLCANLRAQQPEFGLIGRGFCLLELRFSCGILPYWSSRLSPVPLRAAPFQLQFLQFSLDVLRNPEPGLFLLSDFFQIRVFLLQR